MLCPEHGVQKPDWRTGNNMKTREKSFSVESGSGNMEGSRRSTAHVMQYGSSPENQPFDHQLSKPVFKTLSFVFIPRGFYKLREIIDVVWCPRTSITVLGTWWNDYRAAAGPVTMGRNCRPHLGLSTTYIIYICGHIQESICGR